MISDGNYPEGADNCSDAPWKEITNPDRKFHLLYSVTISNEVDVIDCLYNLDEDDNAELCNPYQTYKSKCETPYNIIEYAKEMATYLLNKKDFQCLSKNTLKSILNFSYTIDDEEITEI